MKNFIQLIHKIYPLPDNDLQALFDEGEEISIPKGEHIIREGEINKSIYILKSGVLRGYYSGEDKEVTVWFVIPGEPAFSTWGYIEGRASRLSIEATCDSVALYFSKERIEKLFISTIPLSIWGRKLFERLLLVSDQSIIDLYKPLAAERYIALADKMPEIIRNVPLKDIAVYLGMTPQSLSRVRAGLARKNKQ